MGHTSELSNQEVQRENKKQLIRQCHMVSCISVVAILLTVVTIFLIISSVITYNCNYKYTKQCNVVYFNQTYNVTYENIGKIYHTHKLAGKNHVPCEIKNNKIEAINLNNTDCDGWYFALVFCFSSIVACLSVPTIAGIMWIIKTVYYQIINSPIFETEFCRTICCLQLYEIV